MNEVLLPRPDAGVAVQALVVATVIGLALWRSRDRSDLRLLLVGVGVVMFQFMGLRAGH